MSASITAFADVIGTAGDAFAATVIDTLKSEETVTDDKSPGKGINTGDDTNAGGWIVLLALTSVSAAALIRRRVKTGA